MAVTRGRLLVTLLTVAAIAVAVLGPMAAQGTHGPGIHVETLSPLTGGDFTDNVDLKFRFKLDGQETKVINSSDPSGMVIARIRVDAGAQFPWHTHPGPVLVNVTEGHLTYVQASDCVRRGYGAGKAFVDPGRGTVHTAYGGEQGATLVAVFFEVPDSGPLTIPVAGYDGSCDL